MTLHINSRRSKLWRFIETILGGFKFVKQDSYTHVHSDIDIHDVQHMGSTNPVANDLGGKDCGKS